MPSENNPGESSQSSSSFGASRPASTNVPVAPVISAPIDRPIRVELARSGFLGNFGARLGWIIAGIAIMSAIGMRQMYSSYSNENPRITERFFETSNKDKEEQLRSNNKIAIIHVDGAIMSADGYIKWQIDEVRKDKNVHGVVLRVDSPGGAVTASNNIYHQLKFMQQEKAEELKKPFPIVVSMGGLAASGGYYISMVASPKDQKVIYAEESTMTGSIGVMMMHYDLTGWMEKHNIKDDTLVTHPYKNAGSFTKSFNTEERKIFQDLIDDAFVEFKEKILAGRPSLKAEELDKLATGQIFTAKKAKEVGLIDDIGFIGDAIKQAATLAKFKNVSEVRPIYYDKPTGLLAALGAESKSNINIEGKMLKALQNVTTPRAYYLFSSFPLLEGLSE